LPAPSPSVSAIAPQSPPQAFGDRAWFVMLSCLHASPASLCRARRRGGGIRRV
jgi:hypothetical protein